MKVGALNHENCETVKMYLTLVLKKCGRPPGSLINRWKHGLFGQNGAINTLVIWFAVVSFTAFLSKHKPTGFKQVSSIHSGTGVSHFTWQFCKAIVILFSTFQGEKQIVDQCLRVYAHYRLYLPYGRPLSYSWQEVSIQLILKRYVM